MNPHVAMIARWGVACGMDNYARDLVSVVKDRIDAQVHAGRHAAGVDHGAANVHWDWDPYADSNPELIEALRQERPDVVHVQFNWGVMRLAALGEVMDFARSQGIPLVLQLHATYDCDDDDPLSRIADKMRDAACVIVHGAKDVERLASWGVGENVWKWKLGERTWPRHDRHLVRACLGLQGRSPVVATFGFLQRRKNTLELIRAMSLLADDYPDILLLSSSALHQRGFDPAYYIECRNAVTRNRLESHVNLMLDYLPESSLMVLLQAADLVVLPYMDTAEGTSAAAKFCVAAGRPLVVSSEPIFDGYRDVAVTLEAVDALGIANVIRAVLNDQSRADGLAAAATAHADSLAWDAVGAEYVEFVRSLVHSEAAEAGHT